MVAPSSCFNIVAPDRLHVRRWGDEGVVYDDRTGDSHLLGALAADVLLELQRSPLTRDELLARLNVVDRQAVDDVLKKLTEVNICTVGS